MTKKFKVKNIILLIVLVVALSSFVRQEKAFNRIEEEKAVKEAQLIEIQGKTERLQEEINKIESDEHLEKLAREKLNMLKEGEHSIVVKDNNN